jgi:two-component system, sensor histidine kinase
VLVLDDDSGVREAMATLLGAWGYRVLLAGTVGEAIDLGAANGFDLLIVDYRLPDNTTGAEAIEALRHRTGREIPALVITGDTAPDRLKEASELGLPLLHKPVHPAKLRAALAHLCIPGRRAGS